MSTPTQYDTALITTSDLESFLQRTTTGPATVNLDRLVAAASARASRYCRRKFAQANYTEYFNGTGDDLLYLAHWPVTSPMASGHGVWVSGTRTWTASTKLTEALLDGTGTGTGYVVHTGESGKGALEYLGVVEEGALYERVPGVWPRGQRNVRVIYEGGYASIPEDVQEAALIIAGKLFSVGGIGAWGQSSRTIPGGGTTVSYRDEDIPGEARGILDNYRRGRAWMAAGAPLGALA